MSDDIQLPLSDLTDRELLVLAVSKLNQMTNHEPRLQALEGWVKYAKGAWAVLAIVVFFVAGLFGIHLKSGH